MPRWIPGAKTFVAFARRWGLNAPPTEVWSGVVPTAQVDKHWTEDRIDMWGIELQQGGTPVVGRLASTSLVSGSKEVLVHRISVTANGSVVPKTFIGHLFTPLQNYNPAVISPLIVFPWLQPVQANEPGRLAFSFGLVGENDFLQSVIVNGIPHTSVGPTIQMGVNTPSRALWTPGQDPPFRLKPFQLLTVQTLVQLPVGNTMNVSFFFTEREPQGDVG